MNLRMEVSSCGLGNRIMQQAPNAGRARTARRSPASRRGTPLPSVRRTRTPPSRIAAGDEPPLRPARDEGDDMKTELFYLLLTAILTGVLWIPVVIGYAKTRGPLKPEDYKAPPT